MGLFEEAGAVKSKEQERSGVGDESSIMMTMFQQRLNVVLSRDASDSL